MSSARHKKKKGSGRGGDAKRSWQAAIIAAMITAVGAIIAASIPSIFHLGSASDPHSPRPSAGPRSPITPGPLPSPARSGVSHPPGKPRETPSTNPREISSAPPSGGGTGIPSLLKHYRITLKANYGITYIQSGNVSPEWNNQDLYYQMYARQLRSSTDIMVISPAASTYSGCKQDSQSVRYIGLQQSRGTSFCLKSEDGDGIVAYIKIIRVAPIGLKWTPDPVTLLVKVWQGTPTG
jgi:hypothetical protein